LQQETTTSGPNVTIFTPLAVILSVFVDEVSFGLHRSSNIKVKAVIYGTNCLKILKQ